MINRLIDSFSQPLQDDEPKPVEEEKEKSKTPEKTPETEQKQCDNLTKKLYFIIIKLNSWN